MLSLGLTFSEAAFVGLSDFKPEESKIRVKRNITNWIAKLKDFSEKHGDNCCNPDIKINLKKTEIKYVTGSKYKGQCNAFGVNGKGVYTFPDGVTYSGEYEDGMFKGNGRMTFPDGTYIQGTWFQGMVTDPVLILNGGMRLDEDQRYCTMPDRRFNIERKNFIEPANKSYLTNEQPTREIPPGLYDVGNGFFDPELNAVLKYDDLSSVVRLTTHKEKQWIMKHCRKAPEHPVGPAMELYEQFCELKTYLFDAPADMDDTGFSNWTLYDSEKVARIEAVNKLLEKRILPKTLPTTHQLDILEFQDSDDLKNFLI